MDNSLNAKIAKALKSIEDFQKETNLRFGIDPQTTPIIAPDTPATMNDLAALARQVYYTFDDIGEALKELSK